MRYVSRIMAILIEPLAKGILIVFLTVDLPRRKWARVHLIPDLKVEIFVALRAPDVIKLIRAAAF